MAIQRVTNFVDGVLPFDDLNREFNNIVNYINTRVLTNPLTANIDFADLFTVSNLRSLWNILNVAEFSSLTAAEAALPADGGILFVPSGTTVDLSTTVTLAKPNTWIIGAGWSSVLRRAAGTFSASSNAFLRWTADNCGILNIKVDGAGLANSTGLSANSLSGTNRFFADKVWVTSFGAAADGATVQNDAFFIEGASSDVWLTNCFLENLRRNAVSLFDCDRFVLSGLEITATSDSVYGILGQPGVGQAIARGRVLGCNIRGPATGGINFDRLTGSTVAEDTSRFIFADNTLTLCGNVGTGIGFQLLKIRDAVLKGNTLDQCGVAAESGLFLNQCESVVLNSNTIKRSLGYGARIRSTSGQRGAEISVSDNVVERSGRHGIWLDCPSGSLTDITVADNLCRANGATVTDMAEIAVLAVGGASHLSILNNRTTRDGVAVTGNHSGILFDIAAGTITNVLFLGNNTVGSAQGTGTNISGRGDVTVSATSFFEDSHNTE